MINKTKGGIIEIDSSKIKNNSFYTDRNGVFNGLKLPDSSIEIIRGNINNLNEILDNKLKVISNESEDNRKKVLQTDKNNGLFLEEQNYRLSTQSAANFILNKLKSSKCYYIGNSDVGDDIKNMGLEILDLSNDKQLNNIEKNIPVFFARPAYAINSMFDNDQQILENILKDKSFENLIKIIEKVKPKIVFCHSKPNCDRNKNRENFRELNLGFYFEYLLKNHGYVNGKNIFDLGKGDYGTGEYFDMSLGIDKKNEYENIVGIGDMKTDIEYTMKNGGTGILVNSGDAIYSKQMIENLEKYRFRFYNILDLSYLKII